MQSQNLMQCRDSAGAPGISLAYAFPEGRTFDRPEHASPITEILSRVGSGDREAFNHLIPLVYQELHRIAEGYLRREWQNGTMQPTALLHEAYVRLAEHGGGTLQSRAHFFGVAARVMRQILVDHARSRHAQKRGSGL